jgi:hypothetical protein
MKTAYKNNELQEDDMKFKMVAVDEYKWNKQCLNVFKSLEDPIKALDMSYKVFLLNRTTYTIE